MKKMPKGMKVPPKDSAKEEALEKKYGPKTKTKKAKK